jgi:hypothetical protein
MYNPVRAGKVSYQRRKISSKLFLGELLIRKGMLS